MTTSRRGFLTGFAALLVTAPAIVRAESLMPVKAMLPDKWYTPLNPLMGLDEYAERILTPHVNDLAGEVAEDLMSGRNSLLTIDAITREAVKMFVDSNAFIREISQQYEFMHGPQWDTKIGSSLRTRLPDDFKIDTSDRYALDIRPHSTYKEWDNAISS